MVPTKRVTYRGGIARFDIPASWREEYAPDGGGTFYEDGPDTGTLRLNVLTFASPRPGLEMLGELGARGYTPIPGELALKRYERTVDDAGETLRMFHWEVGIPVHGNALRLAIFSYTVLESQADDPAIRAEVALLDASIRGGEYAREPGMTPR